MSRIRLLTYLCCGLIWGVGLSQGSFAQELVQLALRPERMVRARAVEQQAIRHHDSLLLAEAWYLYGKTYVFAGAYQTAQDYFLRSLRIQEPRGDSYELSRLYVRLSENESRLGRPNEAIKYAILGHKVAQRIRSDKALVRSYAMLGKAYERLVGTNRAYSRAEYSRILSYYQNEEALCHKLTDTLGIAEASIDMGAFFTRTKNPQAIPYLEKGLRIFTEKDKEGIRVKAMLHLAMAYLTFGNPSEAIRLLRRAEQFYDSRNLKEYDLRLELEQIYVAYFTATRQWQPAFAHQKKCDELERSQILADRDGAITRLNIQYQTSKKEAVVRAQERELTLRTENLQNQKRLTYAVAGLLVMAVGMSFVFFRLYRRNQRISQQNEELVKEQNHRVKNNLQVVSSLLSLQLNRLTDDTARQAVAESQLRVQTMSILHRSLYDGDKLAQVDLEEFIRELVMGVLRTFGYGYLIPDFFIEPIRLSADKATPLGLVINELVTNTCKYAFADNENPSLRIRCQRNGRTIVLEVADNGPGLDKAEMLVLDSTDSFVTQTSSFGLALIEAQVTQLNGTGRFTTDELRGGTVFTLEFNG